MTLPSNGYIEINDTNSKIRGMMAGVGGTFSGAFSSLNVNAVENINIKDGAVNAFYGFSFPRDSETITFTVPHQPFARAVEILIPIEVYEYGMSDGRGAKITVYKNGALFKQETIVPVIGAVITDVNDYNGNSEYVDHYYAWYLQTARIMDFEVTGAATYTITFSSWSGAYEVRVHQVKGEVSLTFQGQVTVGFRKR